MFNGYLEADSDAGHEYGRCMSLLAEMQKATSALGPAGLGTLVDDIDRAFADAPTSALPSFLLRNAMDHALLNLDYVGSVVAETGMRVSVPALMGCLRISLLGTSHLCYVISGTSSATAIQRMGGLYKLETGSAAKFIEQTDASPPSRHGLTKLCAPADSAIRDLAGYASLHSPRERITETKLLKNLQSQTIAPLLRRISADETTGALLTDHLFNTTSGAAHGYAWIDLDGVVAHFATQFSWATNIANIVFNDYVHAVGQYPTP